MKAKTKNKVYFADFETITPRSIEYQQTNHTDVWLFCISEIDSNEYIIGNNLDEFFKVITQDRKSKTIYFHNLSFDGNFIFKYLLRTKPTWYYQEGITPEKKYNYFKVFRQNNKYYSIEMRWRLRLPNSRKKKEFNIRFLCSYNLIPSSVDALGKAFNISKMNKDDIQYLINNNLIKEEKDFYDLGGHQLYKDKGAAYDIYVSYIKRDVEIVKTAYKNYRATIEDNNPDAWSNLYDKKNIHMQNILTSASLTQKLVKNNVYNSTSIPEEVKKNYRLRDKDQYEFSRLFYSGGFTQYNPKYHNKEFEDKGFSIDINSSYPAAMTKDLPYGGLQDTPPEGKYLTYVEVKCEFYIKSKYEALICIKSKRAGTRYTPVGSGTYYWLLEEFELYKRIYNIKVHKIKYYYSKCYPFLKPFIDKYYQYKVQADIDNNIPMKNTYKLLLNSLYGGFAKKAIYPELLFVPLSTYEKLKTGELEGVYVNNVLYTPKNFTHFHLKELDLYGINFDKQKDAKKYPNMLVGATITAYARIKLIEAILDIGVSNFIYCDTDSIFFKWNKKKEDIPKSIVLDDYMLGGWKIEFQWNRGKILGAKRYVFENENGKVKSGICGITKVKFSKFDEIEKVLNNGALVDGGKLQRQEDDWGIFLVEKDVVMKIGTN